MCPLLLVLLLQTAPIERYLSEPDRGARTRILAEIKGSPAEVEADLRKPPPRELSLSLPPLRWTGLAQSPRQARTTGKT